MQIAKSPYGLKQASRQWFIKLSIALKSAGFHQSWTNYSLFVQACASKFIVLLVSVDDVILTGNSLEDIQDVKNFLSNRFKLKDLGKLRYFLGIEVARSHDGIALCQRKYALEILEDTDFLASRPTTFPVHNSLSLTKSGG